MTTEIQVGDLVERINSDLDPRPVAIVGTVDGEPCIGLQIGNLVTDPIPAKLYRVVRRAEAGR